MWGWSWGLPSHSHCFVFDISLVLSVIPCVLWPFHVPGDGDTEVPVNVWLLVQGGLWMGTWTMTAQCMYWHDMGCNHEERTGFWFNQWRVAMEWCWKQESSTSWVVQGAEKEVCLVNMSCPWDGGKWAWKNGTWWISAGLQGRISFWRPQRTPEHNCMGKWKAHTYDGTNEWLLAGIEPVSGRNNGCPAPILPLLQISQMTQPASSCGIPITSSSPTSRELHILELSPQRETPLGV